MTVITILKKPDGRYRGFQVIGHADSAQEGADLVCCSVSVLSINLVNSLEEFCQDSFRLTQDEERGLIDLVFEEDPTPEADLLMRSYDLGVHSIAEGYEPWLNVNMKEV